MRVSGRKRLEHFLDEAIAKSLVHITNLKIFLNLKILKSIRIELMQRKNQVAKKTP